MTEIQETIKRYLNADGEYSVFSELCLIGMIETGEATWDDFEAVGGVVLSASIGKAMQRMEEMSNPVYFF